MNSSNRYQATFRHSVGIDRGLLFAQLVEVDSSRGLKEETMFFEFKTQLHPQVSAGDL